jgi:hypothetical protein
MTHTKTPSVPSIYLRHIDTLQPHEYAHIDLCLLLGCHVLVDRLEFSSLALNALLLG